MAAGGLRLSAVQLDGDAVYWLEGRPQEGGRSALVCWRPGRAPEEVTPRDFNVRSRVHEYGGGAYVVRDGVIYCVNFSDQRVYRLAPGGAAEAITPPGSFFYADFEIDTRRRRLICVREDHSRPGEPVNTLAGIPIGPAASGPAEAGHYESPDSYYENSDSYVVSGSSRTSDAGFSRTMEALASGYDFYSTPRLSPDGTRLAWLAWRHPLMPWDGTELWVADVDDAGALSGAVRVTGSEDESIYQPGWGPDGSLYYVSDRDGYWRIYGLAPPSPAASFPGPASARPRRSFAHATDERKAEAGRSIVRDSPEEAEFGRPQWVFGTSTWACAGASTLVVSYTRLGRWHLGTVDLADGELTPVAGDLQPHDWLAADAAHAVFVAGSSTAPDAVARLNLATGAVETLRRGSHVELDAADISLAEPITFPTARGREAHAFYYAPCNRAFSARAGEAPPLVVITHGGPTAAARPTLDLAIQYWTTRGFAVVDVNYGGSSGYGRAYRERLNGEWGLVDVEDVIHAARFLSGSGRADPARLIIRGGSAGGYTTLAALTFHPGIFKAGASYFGISDLEVLEIDTHKFESRYSHRLIGPYPEANAIYRARSPIHAIDRLACPLILFQGLEDKVVPPNQSQMMADAVRAKGLPVAYLAFEGEQHGFRKADTIIRSLEAELYFYGKVFGFTPADVIEPVPIDNL